MRESFRHEEQTSAVALPHLLAAAAFARCCDVSSARVQVGNIA
jgi:hypothetical protein